MKGAETTAVARLERSREKLRMAMHLHAKGQSRSPDASPQAMGLLGLLKATIPNSGLLIEALSQWWAYYTAQGNGRTAADVAGDILRPMAKRHPLALVLGATALGALIAWSKPWRWALKPQLFAAWGPALVSGALASGGLQAWLLSALTRAQRPDPTTATEGGSPSG